MLAHRHEARQRGGIPCARVVDLGQDKLHLLARVVDERGERALLRRRERIAEHLVDFKTHVARPVAQDMRERLVLTVNVGCEELGALRKVQNRAQVDDLGGRLRRRGKRFRKKLQVALFGDVQRRTSLRDRLAALLILRQRRQRARPATPDVADALIRGGSRRISKTLPRRERTARRSASPHATPIPTPCASAPRCPPHRPQNAGKLPACITRATAGEGEAKAVHFVQCIDAGESSIVYLDAILPEQTFLEDEDVLRTVGQSIRIDDAK